MYPPLQQYILTVHTRGATVGNRQKPSSHRCGLLADHEVIPHVNGPQCIRFEQTTDFECFFPLNIEHFRLVQQYFVDQFFMVAIIRKL